MDMMTGGFDARSLRAKAAPQSFVPAPQSALPRWADWRWIAGGATALMLGALAIVPFPEGEAEARETAQQTRAPVAAAAALAPTEARDPVEASFADLAHIVFDMRVEEGRRFSASLERAGLRRREAQEAARMVAHALDMEPSVGTRADVHLGGVEASGTRPLMSLALVQNGWRVEVKRKARGDGFTVSRRMLPPAIEGTMRLSGTVKDGLYWALREAGAGPGAARDYLKAIDTRIDVGSTRTGDRFDLVLEPSGASTMLVYAALTRADGTRLDLVRMGLGKRSRWIDGEGRDGRETRLGWPSNAAVTSSYGMRSHPILGITRMHSGVDFAAPAGSPIFAAADGIVASAGWAGGHGRRVQLGHEGGVATSYSHMSRIAVAPGTEVKRGDVVGYVGSSGLSTGAHLHYEVHLGGRAVDPQSVAGVRSRALEGEALQKVRARLAAYQQLPVTNS